MSKGWAVCVGLFMVIVLSMGCVKLDSSSDSKAKPAVEASPTVSQAQSAAVSPTASQAQPTAAPNTPTAASASTSVPTATVPPATATSVPATATEVAATATKAPPTSTRVPPTATTAPTDTPVPSPTPVPATPTPAFAFASEGIKATYQNCGLTDVNGVIRDTSGNPLSGVTVKVGTDGGWSAVSYASGGDGKWNMMLQPDGPRPGHWYAYVVVNGQQASPRVDFATNSDCHSSSGVQTVVIDFKKN